MSFFANIIHDSRRTIRSSEYPSDVPYSIDLRPQFTGSQDVADSAELGGSFSENMRHGEDDNTVDVPMDAAQTRIKTTDEISSLNNHQENEKLFEALQTNTKSEGVYPTPTPNPSSPSSHKAKTKVQAIKHAPETTSDELGSDISVDIAATTRANEPSKSLHLDPLNEQSVVDSNSSAHLNKLKNRDLDINPSVIVDKSKVKIKPLTGVLKANSNQQPVKTTTTLDNETVTHSELNQLTKQTAEKHNTASEQLLQHAISHLNATFLENEKRTSMASHNDQKSVAATHSAPKVKIGQMNVVVEGPVLAKPNSVKSVVADSSSRTYLRSL